MQQRAISPLGVVAVVAVMVSIGLAVALAAVLLGRPNGDRAGAAPSSTDSPLPASPAATAGGSASPSATAALPDIPNLALEDAPGVALQRVADDGAVELYAWRPGAEPRSVVTLRIPEPGLVGERLARVTRDGRRIVVQVIRPPGTSGGDRFWIFDATGDLLWTAPDTLPHRAPNAWSPDGSALVIDALDDSWLLVELDGASATSTRLDVTRATPSAYGSNAPYGLLGFSAGSDLIYGVESMPDAPGIRPAVVVNRRDGSKVPMVGLPAGGDRALGRSIAAGTPASLFDPGTGLLALHQTTSAGQLVALWTSDGSFARTIEVPWSTSVGWTADGQLLLLRVTPLETGPDPRPPWRVELVTLDALARSPEPKVRYRLDMVRASPTLIGMRAGYALLGFGIGDPGRGVLTIVRLSDGMSAGLTVEPGAPGDPAGWLDPLDS